MSQEASKEAARSQKGNPIGRALISLVSGAFYRSPSDFMLFPSDYLPFLSDLLPFTSDFVPFSLDLVVFSSDFFDSFL